MSDILSSITTRQTEQTQRAKPEQVRNAAGGFVYQADDDVRLHRFLTLGTDGSTYYTSAKDLTRDNAAVVFRCVTNDPLKVVAKIVEISTAGRAPKQNPALFALAICASHASDAGRIAALQAIPQVCRTASTLFTFIKYVEQFRGWGKGLQRAIYRWYNNRPIDRLAYQAVKYRARDDWRHADLLRLAHNHTGTRKHVAQPDAEHAVLYNWIAGRNTIELTRGGGHKGLGMENLPEVKGPMEASLPDLIGWFEELQSTDNLTRVVDLVRGSNGAISWEMIPDRFINQASVWEALLDNDIPQTALLRQLPRLTRAGLCSGATGAKIATQLQDSVLLKRARVHPINVLVAMRTYTSGHGEKGKLTWTPERRISDALDAAFYNAFGAVEATGKSTLLALDLSGSMEWANCSGMPITPREACAALSMVTAAVEPNHEIMGFTSDGWTAGMGRNTRWGAPAGISKLDISPRRRLDDIIAYTRSQPAGGTDCALPMIWAAQHRVAIDTFCVYTDNETWAGVMHVDQALENYRQTMERDARLVVVAMTATGSSLCDPQSPDSMDISGFDSVCPQLISDFSAGRL